MSAAPILSISKDGEMIKEVSLEGEALLGRSEGCVIRLEDRAISRQHALFRNVSGGIQVEKKSEFAPLSVNGEECTRAILKEGDVIAIGPYQVRLAKVNPAVKNEIQSPSPSAHLSLVAENAAPSQLLSKSAPDSMVSPPAKATGQTGKKSSVKSAGDLQAPHAENEGSEKTEFMSTDMLEGSSQLGEIGLASDSSQPNDGLSGGLEGLGAEGFNLESPPDSQMGSNLTAPIDNPTPDMDLSLDPPENTGANSPALAVSSDQGLDGFNPMEPSTSSISGAGHSSLGFVDQDGATKFGNPANILARLVLAPGIANVEELNLDREEVAIGRGKNCDIVLEDKKASRRHAVIRRVGNSFILKDLDSANGLFVNGHQVHEHALSGEDKIRIGNSEFQFKAMSADYEALSSDFLPVPSDIDVPAFNGFSPIEPHLHPEAAFQQSVGVPPAHPPGMGMGTLGTDGFAGVAGMPGIQVGAKKKPTIFDKYRALPPKRKVIWTVIVIALAYFLIFDDDAPQKPQPAKTVKGEKATATFESLTPEQQKFVVTQHGLAFDYYRNKDYDKALFEIQKIFTLIPDYKDSREIERYSQEGKKKLEILAEEQRKKMEEEKLKARIAELTDEGKIDMDKKEYEKAKDLFPQILALDPDNALVGDWAKVVDQWEEQERIKEQARQVQEQINQKAWAFYREGLDLRKDGKLQDAIETLKKVNDIGTSDKKLESMARGQITDIIAQIASLRDPVLDQAKQAEDGQQFAQAYQLYEKATVIDPPHPAGYAGMARVRGILHDEAKSLYIDAVLAESYSDFGVAKKKYQDVLATAPKDDIYHERAERKLASFFTKDPVDPAVAPTNGN